MKSTTSNIADRILNQIDKFKNPSVVGLDPRFEQLPKFVTEPLLAKHGRSLKWVAASYLEFNKRIISLLADTVGFVKPQSAFYEQAGLHGVEALWETIAFAKKKGMIVIADVKRGDIGSTAEGYAKAYLGSEPIANIEESAFETDLITVNPYLGSDGVLPFVKECESEGRGIFVLVKTSNPSSGEFQDQVLGDAKLYDLVAQKVKEWGESTIGSRGYSAVGAVVGATFPQELEKLRSAMPRAIFLVPGFGAQGGTAESVTGAFNKDGYGALISSSRGVTFPYKDTAIGEKEFEGLVKKAAHEMCLDLRETLRKAGISPWN